jgi:zinc/manganese transport system substrate-binding protein
LNEVATVESKPGVPPSAAHLEDLLTRLETTPAAIIIRTPYQDSKPSQWLSNKTGIPNAALPFTVGGSPDATDLFTLFDSTIIILLENMVPPNEQLH